jgi:DNA-binding NtrC family response regulator
MEMPRIIFIDDEDVLRNTYKITLEGAYGSNRSFNLEFYSTPEDAVAAIRKLPFNVALVFMDHHYKNDPDRLVLGSSYIREIKKLNSHIEVIMTSGDKSNESLQLWLKNGADKFLYKDSDENLAKIKIFINQALTSFHAKFGKLLGNKGNTLRSVSEAVRKLQIVSVAPQMESVAELALQSAKSDLSVLLVGDTGTGKLVVARGVHLNSSRAKAPFRTVDCTQFRNSQIIQSELFGSEKGAFTGAESKVGLLEVAQGGTLFIDEAHLLDLSGQAMLLRFLQERKVRRVGGNSEISVDVRLIFAAKPILKEMVERNEFMPDLYYRMNEIKVEIPNLKDRDGDIEALVYFFIDRENEKNRTDKILFPDTIQLLQKYNWPGNVRELENLIRRLCVLVQDKAILPEHVLKYGELNIQTNDQDVHEIPTFDELERNQKKEKIQLIMRAYKLGNYNQAEAARILDIPRKTFANRCKALGIEELLEITIEEERKSPNSKNAITKSWEIVRAYLD